MPVMVCVGQTADAELAAFKAWPTRRLLSRRTICRSCRRLQAIYRCRDRSVARTPSPHRVVNEQSLPEAQTVVATTGSFRQVAEGLPADPMRACGRWTPSCGSPPANLSSYRKRTPRGVGRQRGEEDLARPQLPILKLAYEPSLLPVRRPPVHARWLIDSRRASESQARPMPGVERAITGFIKIGADTPDVQHKLYATLPGSPSERAFFGDGSAYGEVNKSASTRSSNPALAPVRWSSQGHHLRPSTSAGSVAPARWAAPSAGEVERHGPKTPSPPNSQAV